MEEIVNIDKEKEVLGLKWPVIMQFGTGVTMARIVTEPAHKMHTLVVDDATRLHPEGRRPILRQLLCRAHMAENYDALFSTAYFESEEVDERAARDVSLCAEMVLNLWADEIRHGFWSEDTDKDNNESLENLKRVSKDGARIVDELREAQYLFALLRMKISVGDPGYSDLLVCYNALFPDTKVRVDSICAALKRVPDMPKDRDAAVKVLLDQVQKLLEVWEVPDIEVDLTFSDELGCLSWRLPGRGDIL